MTFARVNACRSCGATGLKPLLDLGEQPLANALRHPDDRGPEPRFPLGVVGCTACSLVQLTVTVPPEAMFDSYPYFSSYSTTMVEAMGRLARRLVAERHLGPRDRVVELASNDGYLLRHYVDLGVPVLGVEPAKNVAAVAEEHGVPTIVEYFTSDLAGRLRDEGRTATVLHANNVMAHVPDINDFVAGIATMLAPGGVAVVETPYALRLVESCEFDTIYHEHVFYYSLTAFSHLVERHHLRVLDVEELAVHGGSLRLFVGHDGPQHGRVAAMLADEEAAGVADGRPFEGLPGRVDELRQATVDLLTGLRRDGVRIAAYGAAAKGAVLLNHFGIGADVIDFVVDRNEHKQGLVMPGVGIPVRDPAALLEAQPDYTLLLAWNFADEILEQQAEYRRRGGRFVVPVPEVRVV